MTITEEYAKQIKIAEWIDRNLSCEYVLSDDNEKLSHICFDLSVEHHASINVLCSSKLYGSMYALLRGKFEALSRGLWLRYVASQENIASYKNEKMPINFGAMIKLIEEKIGVSSGLLVALKDRQWEIFCSFTHSGYQTLLRRVGETHTGYMSYQDQEIVTALRFSGLFAVLTAIELASLTNEERLIEQALNLAKTYGHKQL